MSNAKPGFKIVGIVADNYKINKFKKELSKKGFTDYTVHEGATITTIKVNCPDEKVYSLKTLCEFVENHFKRSN